MSQEGLKDDPANLRLLRGTQSHDVSDRCYGRLPQKHKFVQQKLGWTESNFWAADNDLSARFALLQMLGVGRVTGVRGLATMFQGKLLAAEILAEVPWQAFMMIDHSSKLILKGETRRGGFRVKA